MTDDGYQRGTSDQMGYPPNDDESQWTLDNFYFNTNRRTWVRRPKRDPLVVFFGLPLVDLGWNPKYETMYRARYDLGGNSSKVATKEHNEIKFTHCDFNNFMNDVLENRERKCKLGGEIQFAAIAAQHVLEKSDSVVTLGAIGDDYAGTKNKVKTIYKVIQKEQTGFRVIYDSYSYSEQKVQSCRWTVPLAGMKWKHDWLKEPDIEAQVAKMSWVYLDAGSVYADLPSAVTLAKRAADEGQRVAFNFCMTDLARVQEYYAFQPLCELADVVIMNKDQAECVHREWGMGDPDWEKGAKVVGNLLPRYRAENMQVYLPTGPSIRKYVVVTRGAEDIAIFEFEPLVSNREPKVSYVKATPAEKPEYSDWMPKDRRGVGELFGGGLVAGLAKGQTIEEAVGTGHKLAAYSLNYAGPVLPGQEEEYAYDEF